MLIVEIGAGIVLSVPSDVAVERAAGRISSRLSRHRDPVFHSFLEQRRSVGKALTALIQEAYIHGISTCLMVELVEA